MHVRQFNYTPQYVISQKHIQLCKQETTCVINFKFPIQIKILKYSILYSSTFKPQETNVPNYTLIDSVD